MINNNKNGVQQDLNIIWC